MPCSECVVQHHCCSWTTLDMLSFIAFQGKCGEAEPLARRYLAIIERHRVSDYPEVAKSSDILANILRAQVILRGLPELITGQFRVYKRARVENGQNYIWGNFAT